jgi:hypothetical protein
MEQTKKMCPLARANSNDLPVLASAYSELCLSLDPPMWYADRC